MTIEIYYLIYILLLSIYAIAARYGVLEMKRFLISTTIINNDSDIEKMKLMAKKQMSLGVITIPFGFGAIAFFVYYGFNGLLSVRETIVMITFIVINTYATRKVKNIETQIVNIPVSSEELEIKKDHIVHAWQKSLIPKFD